MKHIWNPILALLLLVTAAAAQIVGPGTNIDITITGGQTIASVTLDNFSFNQPSGSAVTVGNVGVSMTTSPAFAGTLSLSDNLNFQLSSTSLPAQVLAKSSACPSPPQSYSLTITATQPGIPNSPFPSQPFTINCSGPTTVSSVTMPNTTFGTASVNNANAVVGPVYLTMSAAGGSYTGSVLLGGADASNFVLTAPTPAPANGCVASAGTVNCTSAVPTPAWFGTNNVVADTFNMPVAQLNIKNANIPARTHNITLTAGGVTQPVAIALQTTCPTADGTKLYAPSGGCLQGGGAGGNGVNGTWTFSGLAVPGGGNTIYGDGPVNADYTVLVNGSASAPQICCGLTGSNGAAVLQLDQGSNMFAMNAGRGWFESGQHNGFSFPWSWGQAPYKITTDGSIDNPHWITVGYGSGRTNIGLGSISDPKYSSSNLTAKVTTLPVNGSVYLGNGTQLTGCPTNPSCTFLPPNGVSTLAGLSFQPNAGVYQSTSPLVYQVTDPDPTNNPAFGLSYIKIGASPLTVRPGVGGGIALTKYIKGDASITPFTTGMTAPTETGFASNQFTVTINSLPNNGTVSYSAGGNVSIGTLTGGVAALQALNFTPTPGNYNIWSKMDYTVTDPNSLSQSALVEVYVGGGGGGGGGVANSLWHDPVIGVVNDGASNIIRFPNLPQPQNAGDIVPIRIQNTTASPMPAGYVTVGMPFFDNAVQPNDTLVVRINNVNYYAQLNCKVTFGVSAGANNSDGSCGHSILTFNTHNTIAGNGSLDVMIAKGAQTGTAAPPSPVAPSATNLANGTYRVDGVNSYSVLIGLTGGLTLTKDCKDILASPTGTMETFLSGPAVNEYVVYDATGANAQIKLTCDIKAYADGTVTTKVVFGNDWFYCPNQAQNGNHCPAGQSTTKGNLAYNVALKNQTGTTVYSTSVASHWLYSEWDSDVDSAQMIHPNKQFDVPYLEAVPWGVPALDTSLGMFANGSNPATCYAGGNNLPVGGDTQLGAIGIGYGYNDYQFGLQGVYPQEPFTNKWIDNHFGISGGQTQNVVGGVNNEWASEWLISQDYCAWKSMYSVMRTSAWAGTWHYTNENTNAPLDMSNGTSPPGANEAGVKFGGNLGFDSSMVSSSGWACLTGSGGCDNVRNSPYSPNVAHQGDYAAIVYLTTGDWYALRQMKYAATYSTLGLSQCSDYSGFQFTGEWASEGRTGPNGCFGISSGSEPRSVGWGARNVAYADLLTPDNDSLHTSFLASDLWGHLYLYWQYFVNQLNSQYNDLDTGTHGQRRGLLKSHADTEFGNNIFYEQFFIALGIRVVSSGTLGQTSYLARQFQDYLIGASSMPWLHEAEGFNPYLATTYHFNVNDGRSNMSVPSDFAAYGPPHQRWVDLYGDNVVTCIYDAPGGKGCADPHSSNFNFYHYGQVQISASYATIAHASNASIFSSTHEPDALRAFVWYEHYNPGQLAFLDGLGECSFGSCKLISNFQAQPIFNIMPQMPDGQFLQRSQMVEDFTNNNNITLNALSGQDTLLLIFGSGTGNTLNAGSNACDILSAGTGTNTMTAGTGSPFMYGNDHATGLTTFHFGGNGLLCGGKGTYTYAGGRIGGGGSKFIIDIPSVAQQQVDFFNPAKDTLFIKQNLNGSGCGLGPSGVACTVNAATTDGKNTTLHIGNETVVLWNVASPSSLQPTITMTP